MAEGQPPDQALHASAELARRAEELGYRRLWYGEHHLNPGVIGYNPALLMSLAGAVTTTLRLGSGAVLAGQRSALNIAEDFALLTAAYGDRIDLGIGRAAIRRTQRKKAENDDAAPTPPARSIPAAQEDRVTREGLLLPAAPDLSHLFGSPRTAAASQLLLAEGAEVPPYGEFTDQLLALLDHTAEVDGIAFPGAVPPTAGKPEVWVLGSSAGESAEIAGSRGLRFGANYHVAPSNVTDAVQHYRQSFVPRRELESPYVIVSAEVLVADTRQEVDRLAAGYAEWVHSIRTGQGAIRYPSPESAAQSPLNPEQQKLVRDRLETRFTGTAAQVAEQLQTLQQATGADELLISVSAHRAEDRLASYELLAEEWGL
nr:LLM class flavin-dependent oxidoreductase [Nesterenkonia alkaliphila]